MIKDKWTLWYTQQPTYDNKPYQYDGLNQPYDTNTVGNCLYVVHTLKKNSNLQYHGYHTQIRHAEDPDVCITITPNENVTDAHIADAFQKVITCIHQGIYHIALPQLKTQPHQIATHITYMPQFDDAWHLHFLPLWRPYTTWQDVDVPQLPDVDTLDHRLATVKRLQLPGHPYRKGHFRLTHQDTGYSYVIPPPQTS